MFWIQSWSLWGKSIPAQLKLGKGFDEWGHVHPLLFISVYPSMRESPWEFNRQETNGSIEITLKNLQGLGGKSVLYFLVKEKFSLLNLSKEKCPLSNHSAALCRGDFNLCASLQDVSKRTKKPELKYCAPYKHISKQVDHLWSAIELFITGLLKQPG